MIARAEAVDDREKPTNGGAGSLCPNCGCSHCPQLRGAKVIRRFGHEFSQRDRECRACKTRFVTEESVVHVIKRHKPKPKP